MKNTGSRLDHVVSSFLEDVRIGYLPAYVYSFCLSLQVLSVTVDTYFEHDTNFKSLPEISTPATNANFGRLHLVLKANSPTWGTPNTSFLE